MTTIDDVDFMTEHSEKDSATFLIDSSVRTRHYYPAPSEYLVEFSEPLRNVFGLDILDATIPGTMYNVDYHNCTLRYYTLLAAGSESASDFKNAFVIMSCANRFVAAMSDTATDYDAYLVHQSELNGCLQDHPQVQEVGPGDSSTMIVAYDILQTRLELMSPAQQSAFGMNGVLNPTRRSIREVTTTGESVLWFWSRGVWYGTRDQAVAQLVSTYLEDSDAYSVCVLSTNSSSSAYTHDIILTRTLFIRVNPDESGLVLSFAAFGCHEWFLEMNTMTLELGNYNISSLASTMADAMSIGFRIVSTSTGNLEKQNRYWFVRRETPFIFDIHNSTISEVIGFDMIPSAADVAAGRYDVINVPGNERLYASSYASLTQDWRIYAPGVVNLLGVRYVTLRCPEIEDHLHGSRSYGSYSTGVGVFKLPSPNEVAQLRFDFVSLIRKPFHPIGKFSKMTFRFEFKPGYAYDFKGINHQILITVKYYSPPRVARPAKSILNPDYNADYLSYLVRVADYAERSSDDGYGRRPSRRDRHRVAASSNRKRLLLEEKKYDYSTTDADDDDDDDGGNDST